MRMRQRGGKETESKGSNKKNWVRRRKKKVDLGSRLPLLPISFNSSLLHPLSRPLCLPMPMGRPLYTVSPLNPSLKCRKIYQRLNQRSHSHRKMLISSCRFFKKLNSHEHNFSIQKIRSTIFPVDLMKFDIH